MTCVCGGLCISMFDHHAGDPHLDSPQTPGDL